jgi:hypothetical protein
MLEEEDLTRVRESWDHRCGLAHVPPYGRNGVGGTGRAPVDDPRLLASLQSQCDQQVLAGGIEDEEERPGEAGRGDSAGAFAARENQRTGCTLIAPRFEKCPAVNHFKRMAGTTGLEPAASAVTGQRSNQLNYVPTRQINEMRNRQCLCGSARFAYLAWNSLYCLKERDSCPNRPQTSAFPCPRAMCKSVCTD